jgi:hypothetical protein
MAFLKHGRRKIKIGYAATYVSGIISFLCANVGVLLEWQNRVKIYKSF